MQRLSKQIEALIQLYVNENVVFVFFMFWLFSMQVESRVRIFYINTVPKKATNIYIRNKTDNPFERRRKKKNIPGEQQQIKKIKIHTLKCLCIRIRIGIGIVRILCRIAECVYCLVRAF